MRDYGSGFPGVNYPTSQYKKFGVLFMSVLGKQGTKKVQKNSSFKIDFLHID